MSTKLPVYDCMNDIINHNHNWFSRESAVKALKAFSAKFFPKVAA